MAPEENYAMDLLITDHSSIRTFSRMVNCASKIGDQIMLVPQPPSTLTIRVINPSQSTFAHFRCHASFFASIHLPRSSPSAKLLSRSLQPLFRAPQSVLTLRIAANSNPVHVLFELKSRTSVLKRFRVPVVTGRLGLTAFDKRAASCMLQARPRLFLDVLAHFHVRLDEITFAPSATTMRVASFVDDVANPANVMLRTEMTIDAREFDVYTFSKQRPIPLTIFCKYLRFILDYCDPFDVPINMWFEAPGMPVLFELIPDAAGTEPSFDAQFIFASRHAEDDSSQPLSPQQTPRRSTASHPRSAVASHPLRTHPPLQSGPQPSIPSSGAQSARTLREEQRGTAEHHVQHPSGDRTETPERRSAQQGIEDLEIEPNVVEETPTGQRRAYSGQEDLPSTKRPLRDEFEEANGEYDDNMDDDDDDEYVEGTPPPIVVLFR